MQENAQQINLGRNIHLSKVIFLLDFEIKEHDLAARVARFKTAHGYVETPTVLPVINPNKILIPPSEMEAEMIITNAYIFWKNHYDEVSSRGVHSFLNYNKPIMTDSGAYQLMEYGDIDISNEEVIEFEKKIGVDIGVILDNPCISQDRKMVEECFKKTMKTLKESPKLFGDSNTEWTAPIQGSVFSDLVKKSSIEASKFPYGVHALGSVVPLLINYEYDKVVKAIIAAKQNMPLDRPLHLFGAGHPMIFSFAVALGVDLFDSAAYALYAKDGRYMTQSATHKINEMKYLPCSCEVCKGRNAQDIMQHKDKAKLLAQHNLNITFEEINTIKEAIHDGTLWELLEIRANSHPYLMKAFKAILKNKNYLAAQDPIVKKHIFVTSKLSEKQPAFELAKKRASKVKATKTPYPPYGNVPFRLLDCYPFNQTISSEIIEKRLKRENNHGKIRAISEYWFGVNIFKETDEIKVSRKTSRLRNVFRDGKAAASFDSSTYLILLHEAARDLHKKTKSFRVVVEDESVEFAEKGKNVFAKFVKKCDKNIVPGQPVLVVDKRDTLLCAGEALMSAKEMMDFTKGVAVRPRWHV